MRPPTAVGGALSRYIKQTADLTRFGAGYVTNGSAFVLLGIFVVLVLGLGLKVGLSGTGFFWKSDPSLFGFTSLMVMGAIAGRGIDTAIELLRRERSLVSAEQRAYEEFATEVQSLSISGHPFDTGSALQFAGPKRGESTLEKIRNLYHDTVMSVPDFEREYNESFEEHFSAEFGPDVSSLLFDTQAVPPSIKPLIRTHADRVIRDRETILDGIDQEERSLRDSQTDLEPIHRYTVGLRSDDIVVASDPELERMYDRSIECSSQLESIIQRRQREVVEINRQTSGATDVFLQEYLYQETTVSYPVLSTATRKMSRLKEYQTILADQLE